MIFYVLCVSKCSPCQGSGVVNESQTQCALCAGKGVIERRVTLQEAIAAILKGPGE